MIKTINESEIKNLLLSAYRYSLRDYTMLSLSLFTGLRVSELVGLYIEDVAPFGEVSSILTVPARVGKNKKKREIPINHEIREILKIFLNSKINYGESTLPYSYIFVSRYTHRPLSSRDFQRIIHNLSISSIGRSITPHILRHTFATIVLKHTNIRVVQELLGHSNIQTTQIYTHVDTTDARLAIDNFKLPLIN